MSIKDNRRVVMVKGDGDKWYEQAIFIVRPGYENTRQRETVDFVREAENIAIGRSGMSLIIDERGGMRPPSTQIPQINRPTEAKAPKKQRRGFDFKLNLFLVCSCLVLAGVIMYNIL